MKLAFYDPKPTINDYVEKRYFEPLMRFAHNIGIEVKASRQWKRDHGRALRELRVAKILTACHAIYLGDSAQQDGPVSVQRLD